jgi:tRNA modification GTPase
VIVAILNKSDLGFALTEEDEELLARTTDRRISLSAKTGAGMDQLRNAVAEIAGADQLDLTTDAILWDARQMSSLTRAHAFLDEAREGLLAGDALDAVCTVCEAALSEIAGVDGRAVDDAIIDGIFARFCVGK